MVSAVFQLWGIFHDQSLQRGTCEWDHAAPSSGRRDGWFWSGPGGARRGRPRMRSWGHPGRSSPTLAPTCLAGLRTEGGWDSASPLQTSSLPHHSSPRKPICALLAALHDHCTCCESSLHRTPETSSPGLSLIYLVTNVYVRRRPLWLIVLLLIDPLTILYNISEFGPNDVCIYLAKQIVSLLISFPNSLAVCEDLNLWDDQVRRTWVYMHIYIYIDGAFLRWEILLAC